MPFKKGDPNINRKGRPKAEFAISERMRQALDEPDKLKKVKNIELIIDKLIELSKEGDLKAIEMLFNRVEGKPIETIRTQEIDKDELIEI